MDYIDYNRRLSAEEHYCLYTYYRGLSSAERRCLCGYLPEFSHGPALYQSFNITEELIDHYNEASDLTKRETDRRIGQDPLYPSFLKAFRKRPWKYEKPVLWADRKKTPYFIRQLNESHAFEVYIDWLFRQYRIDIGLYYGKEQQYRMGETAAGIEIKLDKRSMDTGNYYIEYQERMTEWSVWVNSGILKEDDTKFYLLGTMEKFVIFERGWLMEYYRELVEKGKTLPDARLVREKGHKTSKGFILFPSASRYGNIPIETLVENDLRAFRLP